MARLRLPAPSPFTPLVPPPPQTAVITASLATFELAKDNPAREGALKAARQEINGWVAKYRRCFPARAPPAAPGTPPACRAPAARL